MTPISYQTIADNPVGRNLAVYDAQSSRLLWQDTMPGDVDERLIIIRDQRIYCLVQGVGRRVPRAAHGQDRLDELRPGLQAEFRTPASKVVRELLVSQPNLLAPDDVLLLKAKWVKNTAVLSRPTASSFGRSRRSTGRIGP